MEAPEIAGTPQKNLPKMMEAAYQTGYGRAADVIEVRSIPVPVVESGRVLIQVAASSVNALDWHYMTGTPYVARVGMGLRGPKRRTPGADIAGTVVAVGKDVTTFQPGDEVFGEVDSGGFAEYATARATALARRPENLSQDEASTLGVAALTALQGLRDWGELQPGERVLVNGASGGVGTFAVQIARALGASHVTAVCSTPNVETARSLGADRVVDYKQDDFTAIDDKFDVFFDNAGSRSLGRSRSMLTEAGRLVMVTAKKGRWIRPVDRMLGGAIRSRFWSQGFVSRTATASGEDGAVLKGMVERGEVRPVMDRRFTLDRVVDALEYQAEGHARGKSIVVPR